MFVYLLVIIVSLAAFTVLVGVAVYCALKREELRQELDGGDDIVDRAGRAGRSDLPAFLAQILYARRAKEIRKQLPEALDMISNSLSAGLTLPQALLRNLDHYPPLVAEEFARVLYDTRLGFSIGGAFDNLAARLPLADIRMIAIASKIGVAHGGNLQESYRMLSALLRDKLAFELELQALTTEGRMQAVVMSCLPIGLMLVLTLVQPSLMLPLFTTPVGWGVIGGVLTMQIIAFLWIRKLITIEV